MANNTSDLKKFAQAARRQLQAQVANRLEQVLRTDSAELREKESAVRELRDQIRQTSKPAVIDRVAYTWFNRFCALRFMDVNHYTRLGVVSPAEGLSQPEILQEAKRGYIDDELKPVVDRQLVFDLLNGRSPSSDPQQEAYRLLLVGVCNFYNDVMPFMFEQIADYTELLMPPDLLSDHAILHDLREAMPPEACQDVEVIGWLYQYYISERKDEVFEALKQNQKIEAADIPAATQLFTPHWIVRYLVENSLGRLWMLNHPDSRLIEKMDYYIRPAQDETGFLRIASPGEIKVCDPAGGSGHMLTYGFDLLYAIYEEAGYPATDIPRLILEKNLYGLEIDPRAGALAAFALFMKARAKDRRFFSRPAQPNICVLENVTFTDQELDEYANAVGRDLFTAPLLETLRQFEQADNFGSLIRPMLTDVAFVRQTLDARNVGGDIFLYGVHQRVLKVLEYAEYLAPRYHVVVANPPYMGSGGMNLEIKEFAKENYPDSKSDTYTMFIERNLRMVMKDGWVAMITIPSWMFLSTFENLRQKLFNTASIDTLVHNGRGVWGSDFGSCSFVIYCRHEENHIGVYKRLFKTQGQVNTNDSLISNYHNEEIYPNYYISPKDLKRIPGVPIAYWISEDFQKLFESGHVISKIADVKTGTATTDNDRFMRFWFEVGLNSINFVAKNSDDVSTSDCRWYPFNKGGPFRKWYGNNEYVVNWRGNGSEIKEWVVDNPQDPNTTHWSRRVFNTEYFFRECFTWSDVTAGFPSFRYLPTGYVIGNRGPGIFMPELDFALLAYINSPITRAILNLLNPTLTYNVGNISSIPVASAAQLEAIKRRIARLIEISRFDWASVETSWEFTTFPILTTECGDQRPLKSAYQELRLYWREKTKESKDLEENNNKEFVDTYGLEKEISPEVPLQEITLTCNPYYRYGSKKSTEELDILLRTDTIMEFISYAVGCMFGRYSLDKLGLVLANQGETLQDYLRQVPQSSFMPDEDNAIPMLDGDWFSDDITERFKKFLHITFGDEHYAENLAFIEDAIGRDIRSYFLRDFYKDHVQMYKKRPIYWLFSSPKASFNVLMYMHRYQPDTLSIVLKYLREFRGKLEARKSYLEQVSISGSTSPREKTAALRDIEKLNKTLEELRAYERDTLYPLATQKLTIDLDDGVKVNYKKFGDALAKIVGL